MPTAINGTLRNKLASYSTFPEEELFDLRKLISCHLEIWCLIVVNSQFMVPVLSDHCLLFDFVEILIMWAVLQFQFLCCLYVVYIS